MNQPIVGFVFGRKGLMAGATVEGAEIGTSKKWRVIQVMARS
jgi:lipid-binding SYLF domain-containing protein